MAVEVQVSPHTICAYAYGLRRLFTFLAAEGMDRREFRGPDALRLLAFLRRTPSRRPAQRLGLTVVVCGPARCQGLTTAATRPVKMPSPHQGMPPRVMA
ncbi:hypothetical protein [Streptomyces sp. NPDC004266]|uniref:hypothetical protein n=1 Tax=Streptomyces sp. NPDC004266 TaxID=3364693 RepID=UPI0036998CB4